MSVNKQDGVDNTPAPKPAEPTTDAFGQVVPKEGGEASAQTTTTAPAEKKYDPIPDDHPKIVELKRQIEETKNTYGGNLAMQRKIIDKYESEIEAFKSGKGGKKQEEEAKPFIHDPKTIKFSKDLTKEQREEMTDGEIRLMDQLAESQVRANEAFAKQQEELAKHVPATVTNIADVVKATALELSKTTTGVENIELANQIIEASKAFNLQGLDEKTLKERVAQAQKLLPNYVAPKEQTRKEGAPVNTDTTTANDPFSMNDKIIAEVSSNKGGNYSL